MVVPSRNRHGRMNVTQQHASQLQQWSFSALAVLDSVHEDWDCRGPSESTGVTTLQNNFFGCQRTTTTTTTTGWQSYPSVLIDCSVEVWRDPLLPWRPGRVGAAPSWRPCWSWPSQPGCWVQWFHPPWISNNPFLQWHALHGLTVLCTCIHTPTSLMHICNIPSLSVFTTEQVATADLTDCILKWSFFKQHPQWLQTNSKTHTDTHTLIHKHMHACTHTKP